MKVNLSVVHCGTNHAAGMFHEDVEWHEIDEKIRDKSDTMCDPGCDCEYEGHEIEVLF